MDVGGLELFDGEAGLRGSGKGPRYAVGGYIRYGGYVQIRKGKKTCPKTGSKKMEKTSSELDVVGKSLEVWGSASFNGLVWDKVSFDKLSSTAPHYALAKLTGDHNPQEFIFWAPSGEYRLIMGGSTHCFKKTTKCDSATRFSMAFPNATLNRSYCGAPAIDNLTNTVGYQKGCSISWSIKDRPGGAQFGSLQILQKASVSFGVGGQTIGVLSFAPEEEGNWAVDCGGNCKSTTIMDIKDEAVGGRVEFTLSNPKGSASLPLVFMAPYVSLGNDLDYSKLSVVNGYEFSFVYASYLMMKPKGGEWVPIAKTKSYTLAATVGCSKGGECGTGLGIKGDSFSSGWSFTTPASEVALEQDRLSGKGKKVLELPNWKAGLSASDVFEKSKYSAIAAYFEGSTGNSWVLSKASGAGQVLAEGAVDGGYWVGYEGLDQSRDLQVSSPEVSEFIDL